MEVLGDILEVFDGVGSWLSISVTNMLPMFYVSSGENQGLTFLGVLAVAGLSFSVVFLIIGIIQNFLHFRG